MSRKEQEDSNVLEREKIAHPKMYKVLLHNDDYTTMEFVVEILRTVFFHDLQAAQQIMLSVHTQGHGVCGIYTYEVAESKVAKVQELGQEKGHPLKCTLEEE